MSIKQASKSEAANLVRLYAPKGWDITYRYCTPTTYAKRQNAVTISPRDYTDGGFFFYVDAVQTVPKGRKGPHGQAYIAQDGKGRDYIVVTRDVLSRKERDARSNKTAPYMPKELEFSDYTAPKPAPKVKEEAPVVHPMAINQALVAS